jgi:hypothetical protein
MPHDEVDGPTVSGWKNAAQEGHCNGCTKSALGRVVVVQLRSQHIRLCPACLRKLQQGISDAFNRRK